MMKFVASTSRRSALLYSGGLLALLCAIALNPEHALAQENETPAAPRTTTERESARVEEILVTAQRRFENLQDVPIAVTVVSDAILEGANVEHVTDLGTVVPSLNVTNTMGKMSSSLRGIGSTGIAPGFENPVAFYVDDVFYAATLAPFPYLSDAAQIEVLKGPQGTLFGRNATGGVIHIRTRVPTHDTERSGSLSYGSYDTAEGSLYLAGGLAPGVAGSISAFGLQQGDGFGTNRTTGRDTYRVDHHISVRARLDIDFGPSTRGLLSADYSDETRNDISAGLFPGTRSVFLPGQLVPDIGYDQVADAATFKRSWGAGGSLVLEQDIGELVLKSITAYRESEANLGIDVDQTAAPVGASTYTHPEDQFSQELQLGSGQGGSLTWVTGLYYFRYHGGYDPLLIPQFGVNLQSFQGAESWAGYAQATYEVFPNTNFTLGGRYTTEERTETGGGRPKRVLDFDEFTYRVALDHHFSEQVLGYASFNRGFKSGGFNVGTPGTASFLPETIDAYEIGLKTDLLNRRARLNVAAYYYDYTDIQNFVWISPTAVAVRNAASARVYGVDVDFDIRPSRRLEITGGIGLVSPEYETYPNAPISTPLAGTPPDVGSAAGNLLPLAAEFTANLVATYTVRLAGGELASSVNGYYNSGYFFESDNIAEQPAFALLGANLDWTPADESFSIGAFVRNLTNERIATHSSTSTSGNRSVIWGPPKTYGVSVGFRF